MKRAILCLLAFVTIAALPVGLQAATKVVPPIYKITSYEGDNPVLVQTIAVPGISVDAARDAVERAARNREWSVERLNNGDVQTKLVHRSNDATLTFKFKDGSIEVWSVSYKIDKRTKVRKEREEPEGWIRNLHKDVLALLGLLPE
jgi:hypothetical protein